MSQEMTQGCLFMSFGPISLLAPISLFLQLLSPYYASVVLLGCLYFSSFQFAAIILLLEVSSFIILWNIQVSMIFLCISRANAKVQNIFCLLNGSESIGK